MNVSGFSYCLTLQPTVLAYVTHMNEASSTVAITWSAYRQLDVQLTQAEKERTYLCLYLFSDLSHYNYVHVHLHVFINKAVIYTCTCIMSIIHVHVL